MFGRHRFLNVSSNETQVPPASRRGVVTPKNYNQPTHRLSHRHHNGIENAPKSNIMMPIAPELLLHSNIHPSFFLSGIFKCLYTTKCCWCWCCCNYWSRADTLFKCMYMQRNACGRLYHSFGTGRTNKFKLYFCCFVSPHILSVKSHQQSHASLHPMVGVELACL